MRPRHAHFLGVCGYAIGGAAIMARELGYRVTGSDENAYPPMTERLTAAGIPWDPRYAPENLDRHGVPDLVVVAAGVRPDNPEWLEAQRRGIAALSEIELYAELTERRRRVAVCGTHGKTTTAALLALMLERAGLDPGFRLGATSRDFDASARLGTGPFVFEGDEYSTAPWDPRPKFLHVHPEAACVTRLELDHPDIYPTLEAYRAPFVALAGGLPDVGLLVLCADDAECLALRDRAGCDVVTFGEAVDADLRIVAAGAALGAAPQRFTVRDARAGREDAFELTLPGAHNRQNATAAFALARHLGAGVEACQAACRSFAGPVRRFEVVAEVDGVTVVDDYAHHPTKVAATLAAARQWRPGARILAVFVPHTYSRTATLLDGYAAAFAGTDLVLVGPIEASRERAVAHTVTSADVAARVSQGGAADVRTVDGPEEAVRAVVDAARPGDAVLCLSVGGFDGVARRIADALAERRAVR